MSCPASLLSAKNPTILTNSKRQVCQINDNLKSKLSELNTEWILFFIFYISQHGDNKAEFIRAKIIA